MRRECSYGALLFLKSGVVVQSLGMEVGGRCVVMPKYVACREPSLWGRLGTGSLCRVIRGYGPRGLARALELSGIAAGHGSSEGAPLPLVAPEEAVHVVTPREAFSQSISEGRHLLAHALDRLGLLAYSEELGLTGSIAGGYWHEDSDIDLVALTHRAALELYEAFRTISASRDVLTKSELGGIIVPGGVDVSWRRTWVELGGRRVGVTWIGGLPQGPLHCPQAVPPLPLRAPWRGTVYIPPGDPRALLYPPCAASSSGELVISYEYNLGGLLYEGGQFIIEGTRIGGTNAIVLGIREAPGKIVPVAKSSAVLRGEKR